MDFIYKTRNRNEICEIIKLCSKNNMLGNKILVSYSNSVHELTYDDIINNARIVSDFDIGGIDISTDETGKYVNMNPHLFGDNNIMVNVVDTISINMGDVSDNICYEFNDCLSIISGNKTYDECATEPTNNISTHIIEAKLLEQELETQDGGKFGCFNLSQDDGKEDGIYVKFCSWDETCKHEDFAPYIGKKVRITIEEID